jgi:energy-coupling factor transport system permease protein
MPLTLYVPAASPLHRLHPVTKLAGLLAIVVAAFVVDRPLVLAPLALAVLVLAWPAGAFRNLWRLRAMFILVFLFTTIVWTFFYVDPHTGRRDTADGMLYGLSTGLRLDTFLATGILFLTTTRIEEVAYALGRLHVPYKVGFTLTLAFRLVPVFFDAAIAVVQAQRCRGLDFNRGGLVARLRRFVPVIIPVLMGALRRADRMAMALELRGFNSGRPRTTWLRARAGRGDAVAATALVAMVAVYLTLWRTGAGVLLAPLP